MTKAQLGQPRPSHSNQDEDDANNDEPLCHNRYLMTARMVDEARRATEGDVRTFAHSKKKIGCISRPPESRIHKRNQQYAPVVTTCQTALSRTYTCTSSIKSDESYCGLLTLRLTG